jgi:hypothetical protein
VTAENTRLVNKRDCHFESGRQVRRLVAAKVAVEIHLPPVASLELRVTRAVFGNVVLTAMAGRRRML